MDGRQGRVAGSVQRRLSTVVALAVAVMALGAGALAFLAAYDEARELQDDVLRRVAQLVEAQRARAPAGPLDIHVQGEEDDSRVIVQQLGGPLPDAGSALPPSRLPLASTLPDGLRTLKLHGEEFRVLVRTTAAGERFAVAQDSRLRRELARYGAMRTVLPFVLLVPVLLLVLSRLVRQIFRPITRLAEEVDGRSESDLRAIAEVDVPAEVQPFVRAINRLLVRVGEAIAGQRRFVADAAHELRSPLTALLLQAERLAESELSDDARERVNVLYQGIERSRGLIEQLLALARAQAQGPPPMPAGGSSSTSIQAAFRRVLEELIPLAEVRRIDIGVEGERDAEVDASSDQLFTLTRNLVDNAIRYTPEGGRVDLSVAIEPGRCGLRVRDTGPGIAPAEHERVFEPFYRVPGSDAPGSGLGLAIVRSLAQRLGAGVQLEYSDPERRCGLTVTVWFTPATA